MDLVFSVAALHSVDLPRRNAFERRPLHHFKCDGVGRFNLCRSVYAMEPVDLV